MLKNNSLPIIKFGLHSLDYIHRSGANKNKIPPTIFTDMEIVSQIDFQNLVGDFVTQNKINNRTIILALDPSIYFEKEFDISNMSTSSISEFTSLIPFTSLLVKQIKTTEHLQVIALNKSLLTSLIKLLTGHHVIIKYVIPEFALNEKNKKPYIFEEYSSSFQVPTLSPKSGLVITLSILFVSVIFLLYRGNKFSFSKISSVNSLPTPTIQNTPTPSVTIATSKISIIYPTIRTTYYSENLKKSLLSIGFQDINNERVATIANTSKTVVSFRPNYPTDLRDKVTKVTNGLFRNISYQDNNDQKVDVFVTIGRL